MSMRTGTMARNDHQCWHSLDCPAFTFKYLKSGHDASRGSGSNSSLNKNFNYDSTKTRQQAWTDVFLNANTNCKFDSNGTTDVTTEDGTSQRYGSMKYHVDKFQFHRPDSQLNRHLGLLCATGSKASKGDMCPCNHHINCQSQNERYF